MITYDYLGLWTLRVVTCAQRLDMLRTQDHQFVAWNDFHCVASVELLYCSCEDSDLSGNVFDVTLNQSSYFESHQSHLFKNPTLLHWIFFWSLLHRPLGTVHRGKAYVARPQDVRQLHRRQAELEDALSTARSMPCDLEPSLEPDVSNIFDVGSDIKNHRRESLWCSALAAVPRSTAIEHLGRSNSPADRWGVGKALTDVTEVSSPFTCRCLYHPLSIKIKEENIAEEIEFESGWVQQSLKSFDIQSEATGSCFLGRGSGGDVLFAPRCVPQVSKSGRAVPLAIAAKGDVLKLWNVILRGRHGTSWHWGVKRSAGL